MKKSIIIALLSTVFFFFESNNIITAQNVGIGTTTPDASAKLDIVATDKGVLIPRTDTSILNNPGISIATGLIIYQTTDNKFYYYNGNKWVGVTTIDDLVFERHGAVIRQKANYSDDFVLGRDTVPQNGDTISGNFLFYDNSHHSLRFGILFNSPNWVPDSTGHGSLAYGYNTKASGFYSLAGGYLTSAPSVDETAFGRYNTIYVPQYPNIWNDNDRLFSIGNGTSTNTRHNALTIIKNGDFLLGRDKVPENNVATSGTFFFYTADKGALRFGKLFNSTDWAVDSIGIYSFAHGYNTKAIKPYTTAWGNSTKALTSWSTAWGDHTTAGNQVGTSANCTAWGRYSKATGASATAFGDHTSAPGWASTAWGNYTEADGQFATAWGYFTEAKHETATAFGRYTDAIGLGSTAWGYFTEANSAYETALGCYNIKEASCDTNEWCSSDRLFVIGNGLSVKRHNALTLYKNGDFILNSHQLPSIDATDSLLFYVRSKYAFRSGRVKESSAWNLANIGEGSFAFGFNTKASGEFSAAWGANTIAPSAYETALGYNNLDYSPANPTGWNENDRLFVIGNGDSPLTRHNALTILKNGKIGLNNVTSPSYLLELPNNSNNNEGTAIAYAWDTYSDTRIKSQQKELQYGLKEILALKPKSYIHHSSYVKNGILSIDKSNGEKTIGLIAQEVNKIIPEAVSVPENEENTLWSMNYEKLIPVLIKAIQEQQQTIENLKKRIEILEQNR